jgi:flagellar hook assembly protein FlgD/outer membrane protein OmpA-like peptidoglycan-associated protein
MKKMVYLFLFSILLMACKTTGKSDIIPIQPNFKQSSEVISPNSDGIKDDLAIEGEIKSDNFIRYFRMEILDETKTIVRSIGSEESLEKLQKELFLKKENIEIPKKIIWNGKDDEGKVVKDGKYFFRFVIMDNKKNVYNSESVKLGEVYVDTAKPDADCRIDDLLFSPNNDGNKDTLKADITVKYDALETKYPELKGDDWNVDILNTQDNVVRSFKLNDKQTNVFSVVWDGKNNQGKVATDGIYKMKIYSTDKGGNFFEKTISGIKLDTHEDPVEMTLDESIFSPNGDGVKDSLRFNLTVKNKTDVTGWIFSVFDSSNNQVRKISGKSDLNDYIDWDGKNDSNSVMPEGQYVARLEVQFKNGNISKAESIPFNIDLTLPTAEITIPYNVFSPDGNGIKDTVIIDQKTSEEKTEWNAAIYDANSKIVTSFNWKQASPPPEIKWDGRDNNGNMMPDGEYYYQLSCRDLAGNLFTSPKNKIIINTKTLSATIVPGLKVFSPGNKVADTMPFKISCENNADNPVSGWSIVIKDKDNMAVFEDKKAGDVPSDYSWNGKTNDNTKAPEGEYRAALSVTSSFGSTSEAVSSPFKIDLTGPVISVTTDPKIFSPDGDGENDFLTFTFTDAKDDTGIKNWKLIIINPFTKKEFISFTGEGAPKAPIKWDGKGSNGALVESVLEYPVKIVGEDLVGNVSTKDLSPIPIDILVIKQADGRYKIRISNINFIAEKAVMTKDDTNTMILDKLTKALKKFPDYTITIEGYANKYKKNLDEKAAMKLSDLRAVTIADELIKRGIAKNRIVTVGKGFENPIIELRDKMTNEELEEMAINRRVEFYLSK